MRGIAVVVALVVSLGIARHADACGFWRMEDKEKGLSIGWLINSASIEKGERRLAALYLDLEDKRGMRVTLGKKVVFDIAGTAVRRYGQVVGKRDNDKGTVTFGKHVYTIELTNQHELHMAPAWTLTVKRGDDVIVTSDEASSLCRAMNVGMDDAGSEEEVRRRVIYYLAWRELGT